MDQGEQWAATDAGVYAALREYLDSGAEVAVATVVAVEGSAYRRPGAKMVVEADGERRGAITAGCLEGPVADVAQAVPADGTPRVERFDLTDDSEGTWGMGLGCNGVVDVLVEPVDASFRPTLDALDAKRPVAVATAVESDAPGVERGDRVVLHDGGDGDGGTETAEPRSPLPDDVVAAIREQAAALRSDGTAGSVRVESDDGAVDVFVDGLEPVPDLLVFGHGPDVRPVARLGREAGFRVVVAAGRGGKADESEFPAAHDVRAVRAPDAADAVVEPAHTYAVVMSHNFLDDRLALESLLDAGVPYVGLMGPRERFERMRDELADEGRQLGRDDLDRVSTPVGLDLGGGSPMEIAFSIVSEAIAVRHGRDGGRLSERDGPIHVRTEVGGE
jgi:xanthine dehydrogenase accessory factor